MSKFLEGNGRWGTKFISPEHRDQLNELNDPDKGASQKVPQQILIMVRDSVLLPIMMTVVENNRLEIERSNHSLKTLYSAAANTLLNAIHADLAGIRKELREHHIKVIEEERVDDAAHYKFYYRGYEHKFALMRFLVRSEISTRLGKYIAQLEKHFSGLIHKK
ncbi:hypothetical protein [Paenibacillus lignilyticus]|nr:hypothetical protein [Paenibacillus lignilyticus]